MKKIILIILLCFVLLSCNRMESEQVNSLDGKYFFDECVYLNPLSSSTKDHFSDLHSGIVYIIFDDESIEYRGTDQAVVVYSDVIFRSVPITQNLDDIINLDIDNVFNGFDIRYDIYSDNSFTGLSLFLNENTIFLAEIRLLGEGHNDYFVWTVFSISKTE